MAGNVHELSAQLRQDAAPVHHWVQVAGATAAHRRRRKDMFKHLLVAIDGNEPSRWAVREAGEVAARDRASITLLTAFDLNEIATMSPRGVEMPPFGANKLGSLAADLTERGNRILADARALLPADIDVDGLVVEGNPAEEILRQLERGGYDLVVLGSRGRGTATAVFGGSVSQRVLHGSPVPVLVYRHPLKAAPVAAAAS
jgi:nucleotide-binding universal stress UspA family protein